MNYEHLSSRKKSLENDIARIKTELKKYPKGYINLCKDKGKYRMYRMTKDENGYVKRNYLPLKEIELAKKLARKKYLQRMLADKENELACTMKYLNMRHPGGHQELLSKESPYRALILEDTWEGQEYEKNSEYPEQLIVKAPKGEYVRSKSEALIANALYDAGIEYRYECATMIGGIKYYPDFTVRVPGTKITKIWEHFGKIDDPEYFSKMMRKISAYIKAGYVPGVNLIFTFESSTSPLTIDVVKSKIQHHFRQN